MISPLKRPGLAQLSLRSGVKRQSSTKILGQKSTNQYQSIIMVSFSREPRLLKSQRIMDKIKKEVLQSIASITLILICIGGCYVMLEIMAKRPPRVKTEIPVPILYGSNSRENCKCLNSKNSCYFEFFYLIIPELLFSLFRQPFPQRGLSGDGIS